MSIRFLGLAKSKDFIVIGWDSWFKKIINYLICIEGKGVVKTITVLHKMPRYLLIYYKISFIIHNNISYSSLTSVLFMSRFSWFHLFKRYFSLDIGLNRKIHDFKDLKNGQNHYPLLRLAEILELILLSFELYRREGRFENIHCIAQNATLSVDLLWNIFS